MTPRNFLVRGLAAGFIAGLFAFAFGYFVAETQVGAAIAVEEAGAAAAPAAEAPAHDHPSEASSPSSVATSLTTIASTLPRHGDEDHGTQVSRQNQSTWGLATGLLTVGTAIGGVIGLLSAFVVGRLGRLRPSQSTALVTLIGFISFALVPFLKYPSAPPAVGDEGTIGQRTLDFFVMQGISVVAAVACVLLARLLLKSLNVYRTALVAGGTYLVVVVVAGALMPTVNELGDFPADILWYFRRDSIATLAILWGVIGIVLAGMIGRLHEREALTAARKNLAASL